MSQYISGTVNMHFNPDEVIGDFSKIETLKSVFPDLLGVYNPRYSKNIEVHFKPDSFNSIYPYQYPSQIITLLFEYLLNLDNSENLKLLNQKLNDLLISSEEPYHILKLLIIINLFNHYPQLKSSYSFLYQYFQNLAEINQNKFYNFQISNATFSESVLTDYYEDNFHHGRYNRLLSFYSLRDLGGKLMDICYSEKKMTVLGSKIALILYALIQRLPSSTQSTNTYRGITGDFANKIATSEIGASFQFNGFSPQALTFDIAFEVVDDYGVVLELHYPKGIKFLPISEEPKEVIIYPNSVYRLVNKYIKGMVAVCELEYIEPKAKIEYSLEKDLPDFDNQFIAVMNFLNQNVLYENWIAVYIYFLEHLEELEKIVEKNNLNVGIYNDWPDYINKFENYFNEKAKNVQRSEEIMFMHDIEDQAILDVEDEILDEEVQNDINMYLNEYRL